MPTDAKTALAALNGRIGSPTWSDMRATTQALLRRIGAHVATHDKSGLQELRATQNTRLGQVNVRPYSDPEDMAESYANDYGRDLHDHFSLSLREIDDALHRIDQDVRNAVAPRFTAAVLADARAAEQEKRRADLAKQREQASAAEAAATAAAAAAEYRQQWLRRLPGVASQGVESLRALLDAASEDAPLEALEALRDAGWGARAGPNACMHAAPNACMHAAPNGATMLEPAGAHRGVFTCTDPSAASVLEHLVSRCPAGSRLARVLWALATSATVRNGECLTSARLLRACAARFASPEGERCPVSLS